MQYLDFDLKIGAVRERSYPVTVLSSPAGQAEQVMAFPFEETELEQYMLKLQNALLYPGEVRRPLLTPHEEAIQAFGQRMFEALLAGEILTAYERSLTIAGQEGKGLRVRLRIQPPELAVLPWEYSYDHRRAAYICLNPVTPLVRYLDLPQPIGNLEVKPPVRILAMAASPSDQSPLDTKRARERTEEEVAPLVGAGVVALTWVEGQCWRHLQRAMWNGPYHIFHFIGHGGFDPKTREGVLGLADEKTGATYLLSASHLAYLLESQPLPMRLVLLDTCEGAKGDKGDLFSSTASILVQRGIPAVLAMQEAVTDTAAIELMRTFYEALADGLPVDRAVAEARQAIRLQHPHTLEWGTPVLFMRSPDGVLFTFPQELRWRSSSKVKTREEWLQEGAAQLQAKHYQAAQASYQQAIALDPQDVHGYVGKAEALNRLGQYEEALTACYQALQFDPKCAEAYKKRGTAFNGLQLYQEALTDYEKAVELAPEDAGAYNTMGGALLRLGRLEGALLAFEHAIQLDDQNGSYYSNKATALRNLGRHSEALKACSQAIQLDPSNADLQQSKGDILLKIGLYSEALKAFKQAIALDLTNARAYRGKGLASSQLGRWEDAIEAYDRAIQMNPQDAQVHVDKGLALESFARFLRDQLASAAFMTHIGDPFGHEKHERRIQANRQSKKCEQEALEAYQHAINLNTTDVDPYVRKAELLVTWLAKKDVLASSRFYFELEDLELGDRKSPPSYHAGYEEALTAIERAIELESDIPEFYAQKAQILHHLQRYAEAEQAASKARELGYQGPRLPLPSRPREPSEPPSHKSRVSNSDSSPDQPEGSFFFFRGERRNRTRGGSIICPRCGHEIRSSASSCDACGLSHSCITCGVSNRPGAVFCTNCGTQLPERPEEMGLCSECGHKNGVRGRFCKNCGSKLERIGTGKREQTAPSNTCPHCGHNNPPNVSYCQACGSHLQNLWWCKTCGAKNSQGDAFCSECGAYLP